MMPDNLFNTMERFAALKIQDVAEDILDIIDSENSGLSAEGRLDEIKADMKRVIDQTNKK